MQILLVTDFLRNAAGTEYITTIFAWALKKAGTDVRVFSTSPVTPEPWGTVLQEANIPVLSGQHDRSDGLDTPEDLADRLEQALGGWQPDLIHGNPLGPTVFHLLRASRFRNVPLVATETNEASSRCWWYDERVFRHVNLLDGLTASCNRVLHGEREYFGYEGPLYRIPFFIAEPSSPPSAYQPEEGTSSAPLSIGFIGPPCPRKGFDVLLQALCNDDVREAVTVTTYGDDAPQDAERQVADTGLSERVRVADPFHPINGISRVCRRHDAFVWASRFEGFPIASLEVAARGLPIVATDVGGLAELLKPSGELVVPPEQPAALAGAINRLVSNYSRYLRRAQERAPKVRRAYGTGVVTKILDMYRDVLQRVDRQSPRRRPHFLH